MKHIKEIKEVQEIIVITNGTLLTTEKIDALEEAGLDRINLSFHATSPEMAKKLFGMEHYNVEKVMDMIRYMGTKKMELMITPVWVPGINDKDVEDVIKVCVETGARIGLQKYEVYPYSRKMKGSKKMTYWKFRDQLKKWEKSYNIPLLMKREDVHLEKRDRVEEVFRVGEKLNVKIKAPGWYPQQMIAVAKNRCISILKCTKNIDDDVNVKIVENKNNLYMAEQV